MRRAKTIPEIEMTQYLYRHFIDKDNKFATEKYQVVQRLLIPQAYRIERPEKPGKTRDVQTSWIGRPRAAELWSCDPDPEKAYQALVRSAKKDLDDARGRLAVYESLYDRLLSAAPKPGAKGDDAQCPRT